MCCLGSTSKSRAVKVLTGMLSDTMGDSSTTVLKKFKEDPRQTVLSICIKKQTNLGACNRAHSLFWQNVCHCKLTQKLMHLVPRQVSLKNQFVDLSVNSVSINWSCYHSFWLYPSSSCHPLLIFFDYVNHFCIPLTTMLEELNHSSSFKPTS